MKLQESISYKDPSGYIVKEEMGYFRIVDKTYSQEYNHLINSGLYQELIAKKLIIAHEEIQDSGDQVYYYKKIFPTQIVLITYPYEWTFSQFKEMVLCYLEINIISLKYGMILKDANPSNFSFHYNKCCLIDTLSFDFYKENSPWRAYKVFCEELLSPFLLMFYNGFLWGKLYRISANGLPLKFVSKHLPIISYFNASSLLHIHAHSKFLNSSTKIEQKSTLNKDKLNILFKNLRKDIKRKKNNFTKDSIWKNYYETDIEKKYLEEKIEIITSILKQIQPEITVDIGSNNGKFSILASRYSKFVYSIENDPLCIEDLRRQIAGYQIKNIFTIVADIAEPSPGLGWSNTEKPSLINRIKCDTILALAVVHHLSLSRNIPLNLIAQFFSEITVKFAIVEFIPKSDVKAKLLMQTKGDIFEHYNEEVFISVFSNYFRLNKVFNLENSDRKIFLWEKK